MTWNAGAQRLSSLVRSRRAHVVLAFAAFCVVAALLLGDRQPISAADSLAVAQEKLAQGNYAEAIKAFEQLADAVSAEPAARIGLLEGLRVTGQYSRVEELASRYIQDKPSEPAFTLLRGRARQATGRYADAEADYKASLAGTGRYRDEAELHLGLLLEQTGRREEGRAALTSAYRRAAGTTEGASLAAVALQRLGRFKDANSLFQKATTDNPRDVETWNAWGRLFLEKYDQANAASVFQDALELNPNHPETLLGLARSAGEETAGTVGPLIEKCLAVNPNSEEARVLLAEAAIQAEDWDEAQLQIDKCLAVNPNSLEGRSVKTVLSFATGRPDDVEREIQEALKLNPHYGQIYEALADFAVTQRFYSQAVDYLRKAVQLDESLWTAYSALGINLLRLGDESHARQALETAYANDPFNVWTVNTLRLLDSYENFNTIQSEGFRLKLHKKESELLNLYVTQLLDEVLASLSKRYNYRPQLPLYLEIYPDHEDFAVRTLGLPGLGALGVCFGPGIVMDSPSARPKGTFNWGSTLWHEFAHVITLGMTEHRVPRWFSEGLSVREEHRARPGWGDPITLDALRAIQEKKLLPISELNQGFQRPRYPGQVQISYFQAGEICEFIEQRFGFPKILAMLQGFRESQKQEQIFQQTLGVSSVELDRQFDEHLRARYAKAIASVNFALLDEKETEQSAKKWETALAANPDDFFANVRLARVRVTAGQSDTAIPLLERAKAVFPAYTGPHNPYQQLAGIYEAGGGQAKAIAELEALTSINGANLDALKKLGELSAAGGRAEQAIAAYEKALYVYPFEPETHQALADLAMGQAKRELALREYRAVLAMDPVDKAAAHYNVARVLFEMGRRPEARGAALAALEIAPGYAQAQELLLKLSD